MTEVIIAALVIMTTSLIGVVFTQKAAGAFLEKNLHKLISFAGGVFLVTALALAAEVFHIIHSPLTGIALILLGYGLAWGMHYLIPESHHQHDAQCGKSAKKLITGDAVHNIGDGIILVPAFMASTGLGWTVAISIIIHEAIQEISEYFVLRRAGYSAKKALLINFLVSSTILIGVAIGALALATAEVEGLLLALTSGFFLHVVFHDLILQKKDQQGYSQSNHLILVGFGIIAMLLVNVALGDTHTHGEYGHDHDHSHEEHGHEEHSHDHSDKDHDAGDHHH